MAVGTLAFPVLEALSTALGVTALTSGIGACMRSTRAESILRTFACLGAVLGTVAAITAIARVDKTIIDLDQQQLERRVPPLPTPGTGSRSPVPHREGKQPGASSRPDRSRQPG